MTSNKEIERGVAKRSPFNDESLMPAFPVVHAPTNSQEKHLQKDGHSLKPPARKVFKRTSSNLEHVLMEDTNSGSEHESKNSSFKLGHDARESSLGVNIKDNKSGSGRAPIESSSAIIPTPQLTLKMRPTLTWNFFRSSHDNTFYEDDETTSQPQILSREAAVEMFNHDTTMLVTPRSYPSSAAMPLPPPVPQPTDWEGDILETCMSEELFCPMLE